LLSLLSLLKASLPSPSLHPDILLRSFANSLSCFFATCLQGSAIRQETGVCWYAFNQTSLADFCPVFHQNGFSHSVAVDHQIVRSSASGPGE
jgi:hypothetical protein